MGTHRQRSRVFWAGAMLALGVGAYGCPGDTELAKGDGANQGDGSSGSGGGDAGANGGGVSGSGASGSGSSGAGGASGSSGTSGSSGGGRAGSGSMAGDGGSAGGAAGSGVADDCPPGVAIPAICMLCPDNTCGQPVCKGGAFTGDFACAGGGDAGSGGGAGSGSGDSGGCVHAGCSSQLCLEASVANDIATTCEFREEYACYQAAECARQSTGQCGFTESKTLSDCLAGAGGTGQLHWQTTCGDPVCSSQPDPDDPSVPNCTNAMQPGAACDTDGETCETGACGGHLVCSADSQNLFPCPSG